VITEQANSNALPMKSLSSAFLINLLWINMSEVFRYFVFIMDMMREAFPQITDIAPMSPSIFLIWGIWDTILVFSITGFSWLFLDRFGHGYRNAIIAATLFWMSVFLILWLGLYNMNLATEKILLVALPLAWFEMIIASIIVLRCVRPSTNRP